MRGTQYIDTMGHGESPQKKTNPPPKFLPTKSPKTPNCLKKKPKSTKKKHPQVLVKWGVFW